MIEIQLKDYQYARLWKNLKHSVHNHTLHLIHIVFMEDAHVHQHIVVSFYWASESQDDVIRCNEYYHWSGCRTHLKLMLMASHQSFVIYLIFFSHPFIISQRYCNFDIVSPVIPMTSFVKGSNESQAGSSTSFWI